MIDVELLRRDPAAVKRALQARGYVEPDVDAFRKIDTKWRSLKKKEEERRHRQRQFAEPEPAARLPKAARTLRTLAEQREALWKKFPNLPLAAVPVGRDATENVVREKPKELPEYAFLPLDHLAVGLRLGIIDHALSAVASGTRFGTLVADGALLAFALVQHAFAVLTAEGFTPILPPVLIKRAGMDAMGYLERGESEVYATQDNLMLVGTSEQALGARYAGHTFADEQLPVRFVAFSSCFRREAGSHGKDVRGLLRLHQFEKVEMFSFCRPEESGQEHTAFLAYQKRLMDDLELRYRVVDLCTGDLGFAAASTIDLETWFPSRKAYVETSSTSNTTDFQTRRLGTKVRQSDGSLRLAHAVNGTAYALQRTMAALLETHQRRDGSVAIPAVLQPYVGGQDVLRPPTA